MIISASRRTDIPAFYSDWFLQRLQAGYVIVRNPLNFHQLSRINLSPEVVDCIVFWTKNPAPLLPRLSEIDAMGYKYCFQYTLNPYGPEVEPSLPPLDDRIALFRELSLRLGREAVIWRYDPILLTDRITKEYHREQFTRLASELAGSTERCVISFVDMYEKTQRNTRHLNLRAIYEGEMRDMAEFMVDTAREYGMEIQSCSEAIDLASIGIKHGKCIDSELIERIIGCPLVAKTIKKDKNQHPECGCIESIDVGVYNTCRHGCTYCYANSNGNLVSQNSLNHEPASELLVGRVEDDEKVTERKVNSNKSNQPRLFE